jgi:hypothetical protein
LFATKRSLNVQKIAALLVNGKTSSAIMSWAVSDRGLGLSEAQAGRLMRQAKKQISRDSKWSQEEELGLAVSRLRMLYAKALSAGDTAGAFSIQRELNSLTGLRGRDGDGSDGKPPPHDDGASRELAAARAHLAALNLGGPDVPVSELARLAVQRIVELMTSANEEGKKSGKL